MLGSVPIALGVVNAGPRILVAPGTLGGGVAFARASPALVLGADGTTWGSAAAATPRFHGTARRLLVEGARTNTVRNPLAEGASSGTPGTAPTNWSVTGAISGLTRQIVGTGVESGIVYLDVRYAGTATAAGALGLLFDGNTAVPAASGQIWTGSCFTRIIAGSLSGFTPTLLMRERDSAGASLASSTSALSPGATLAAGRQALTRALNQAACAYVQAALNLAFANGAVVDVTLRIGLPQLEQGSFASSPVVPPAGAPAATTRQADAPSVALLPASAAAGTLVLRATLPQTAPSGLDQGLLQLDDGTDANRILLRNTGGGAAVAALVVSGGATLATLAGGTVTAGTAFRAVLAWDPAGTALCLGGGTVQATASAPPVGLNRLLIGHGAAALNRPLCGEVERLELHAARLPDATLLALANA